MESNNDEDDNFLDISRRDFLTASSLAVVASSAGCVSRKSSPIITEDSSPQKNLVFDINSVSESEYMSGSLASDGKRLYIGSLRDSKLHCYRINGEVSEKKNWVTFHGDYRNTSYIESDMEEGDIEKVWEKGVKNPVFSQPVISGKRVYLVMENRVYCFNKYTGEELWVHKDDVAYAYPCIGGNGDLYVQAVDDFKRDKFIRTTKAKPEYFDAPASLTRFDAESGEIKWVKKFEGEITTSKPTYYDGSILFSDHSPTVYSIDSETGRVEWSNSEFNEVVCSVAPSINRKTGEVYLGTQGAEIYSIDISTGETSWISEVSDNVIASGPVITDSGLICYGCFDKFFYAISSNSGELVWKTYLGDAVYASPAYDGEKLYALTANEGKIYALNEKSGKVIWDTRKVQEIGFNSPILIGDFMYFGSGLSTDLKYFKIR